MGSSNKGWIKVWRKTLNSEIWESGEPYDRRSAWIELLLMAGHEEDFVVFDGKKRDRLPGQIITSISALSRRFHWSRKKVRSFLGQMGDRHMIRLEGHTRYCLLTIENWDIYQSSKGRKGQTSGTDLGTPRSIYEEGGVQDDGLEQHTVPAETEDNDYITMDEWEDLWGYTTSTRKTLGDSSVNKG